MRLCLYAVMLSCLLGSLDALFCPPAAAAETPVARKLLVLYSGSGGQTADQNIWRRGFDMVGTYYGLLSEYRDIAQPPPEPLDPAQWRAIVCAYNEGAFADPAAYLDWMLDAMDKGIRVLFLTPPQDLPAGTSAAVRNRMDTILGRLGLGYRPEQTMAGNLLSYGLTAPGMHFERPLPAVPPLFTLYTLTNPERATPWLTIRHSGLQEEAVVVAISTQGAMALPAYVYWVDPENYKHKWYLDPFAFLGRALAIHGLPVLTPTTLNGKRVAISHIDADGFNGFTEVDKGKNCAEIMYENVLTKTDFPVTVSVIQAEVDPRYSGNEKLMAIARSIFALPNVEPASHSFTHPFYWDSSDTEKARQFKELDLTQYGIPVPGYTFDPKTETVDSCTWITEHLAPADKPCRLMLWSGSCDPKPFVMKPVHDAGLLNMNGGDTIYDQVNDSLTTVSPLLKMVGPYVQPYTGQANENILTNLWTGPYHAYRYITRTMERTGTPRRLMPVDAYYHFYSAEHEASLQALHDVYAWIATQDVARMFTTAYVPMVLDFASASIARDGGTDIVRHYGNCLSIRYDDTERVPDLARCTNVLGYEVQPQGLFVHLRPGGDEARIVLRNGPGNAQPHIRSATGWIRNFHHDAHGLSLQYAGFGTGSISLGGLPGNAQVNVTTGGTTTALTVSPQGILTLSGITTGDVEMHIP